VSTCPFCAILAGDAPADIVAEWPDAVVFVPLRPCTRGHVLVIPRLHVRDAIEDPETTALVARRAAEYCRAAGLADANLIANCGRAASQSVWHLHLHVVPRTPGDGLRLPWSRGSGRSPTPLGAADALGHVRGS
jgi:histidine triad (HIT) family protein